jgi:hypothetical protein
MVVLPSYLSTPRYQPLKYFRWPFPHSQQSNACKSYSMLHICMHANRELLIKLTLPLSTLQRKTKFMFYMHQITSAFTHTLEASSSLFSRSRKPQTTAIRLFRLQNTSSTRDYSSIPHGGSSLGTQIFTLTH